MSRLSWSRWLQKLAASSRRTGRPRRRPFTRPCVESLEDRTTPTVLFTDPGSAGLAEVSPTPLQVIQNPKIELVYWGSGWDGQTQWMNDLTAAVTSDFTGPYLSGLAQYGTSGKATIDHVYLIDSSSPAPLSTGGYGMNYADASGMIDANIRSGALVSPDSNTLYDVIPQPQTHSTESGAFASHGTDSFGADIAWTHNYLGTQSAAEFNDVLKELSHETAEAISDPAGQGALVTDTQPWVPVGDNEIGDPWVANDAQMQLNGYTVQPYFSLKDHVAIVPNGQLQNLTLSTSDDHNYTLTIAGDQLTNKNDTIAIGTDANGGLSVTLNGETNNFDPSPTFGTIVTSVVIDPGAGTNAVTINSTPANLNLTIDTTSNSTNTINLRGLDATSTLTIVGAGANTVNIGNASNTTGTVLGTVNIDTAGATTALTINDAGDSAAGQVWTVTGTSVSIANGNGISNQAFNYSAGALSSLTLDTGGGTIAGSKPLTVDINSTPSKVTLLGSMATNVNVGNGSLQNVPNTIVLENSASAANTVVVNDSTDGTPVSMTLDTFTPSGDGLFGEILRPSQGAIEFEATDTASLTIDTGKPATTGTSAQVSVDATPVNTTLTGAGATSITLNGQSNGLAGIAGSLTIQNSTNATALTIDDSADITAGGRTATLGANSLSGLTTSPISFSGLNYLSLTMPTGFAAPTAFFSNQVFVTGTASNVPTTINVGGSSNDSTAVTIDSDPAGGAGNVAVIHSQLTVAGSGSGNSLIVNDLADTAGQRAVTITSSTLGAASTDHFFATGGSLTYSGINHLTIKMPTLAATSNTINVTGTASGNTTTVLLAGSSTTNNSVNVGSAANTVKGVVSLLSIQGQGGTNSLTVNDSGDTSPAGYDVAVTVDGSHIGNGSADNMFGTGGSISYGGLKTLTIEAPLQGYNNILFVRGTAGGTETVLDAGASSFNNILVGDSSNTVKGVVSELYVQGQSTNTTMTLNDSGNTSIADKVTVTPTNVGFATGDTFFGINGYLQYASVPKLTVDTSSATTGDTITVTPQLGQLFTINGGNETTTADKLTVNPLNGVNLYWNPSKDSSGNTIPNAGYYTQSASSTTKLVSYTGIAQATPLGLLAVADDAGGAPLIHVYDAQSGTLRYDIHPFDASFSGGVRVAVADVNGDGVPDIIAAQGPGGDGLVHVFDGITGRPLAGPLGSFQPFGPDYHGGLWVAGGDINADGHADVIAAEDQGGQPRVEVFSGQDGSQLANFLAFDSSFAGGVRLASADLNHDGHADIVAAAGPGGAPQVHVYEGAQVVQGNTTPELSFDAYDSSFTGGVYVATGLVHGGTTPLVLTGEGAGGQPRVNVFDASGSTATLLQSFLAFDPGFQGGVRVAAADVNGDGRSDIVVAEGPGGLSEVRGYDGESLARVYSAFPFPANFHGGLFVAAAGRWGNFHAISQPGTPPPPHSQGNAAQPAAVVSTSSVSPATVSTAGTAVVSGRQPDAILPSQGVAASLVGLEPFRLPAEPATPVSATVQPLHPATNLSPEPLDSFLATLAYRRPAQGTASSLFQQTLDQLYTVLGDSANVG